MTPSDIKPKMKFGHWEVIKYSHKNKHCLPYFLCRCDVCGTERPVRAANLLDGRSTSCSRACSNSLVGQKFNGWTVLKRDPSKQSYYWCQCECGEIRSVHGPAVKYGKSLSCGCLGAARNRERNLKDAEAKVGEKHGKLTILEPILKVDSAGRRKYSYKCLCDCGNTTEVIGGNIFNGNTTSCGCINSKANEEMARILTRLNIPFKREYRIEDCRDVRPLPFDFAIFSPIGELLGLIENNGSQHYSARGTQWNTPERFVYIQKHDYIKQDFCEKNNIPLLIIPYQYFNELEKFLTTSDFWQIITKNFND